MPTPHAGGMRERLLVQSSAPVAVRVSSLTRSVTTATATTVKAHGYVTGDYVTVAGASQAGYNGRKKITVTGPSSLTYAVAGSPDTPATGTITAIYSSDAQGGQRATWSLLDTIAAEMIPIRASERLQAAAIQAVTDYRFRVRVRPDLTAKMRALWTASWPPGSPERTLEIHGVIPWSDGRQWLLLDCGEVAT